MNSIETKPITLRYLTRALVKYSASDLHIKLGRPPLYRINGKIFPAKMPVFSTESIQNILLKDLTPKQISQLEMNRSIDYSFYIQDVGRFRCNIYYQKNTISAAIRMIPFVVPSLDELGVPKVIKELCSRLKGLILVTGSTGSGKSTTLAAIIRYFNEHKQVHILSVEDPIEFTHRDHKALITQREVGSDTFSMREAIISGMRQDPDVIVVGEIRDLESIQAALTAAETGHLVISTLHTNDAKSSIDRILDVFPSESKNQVRLQLAANLVGVFSQHLLPRVDGSGRIMACEVMVKSPAIQAYIMKNELDLIPDAIANSAGYYKMQTKNKALERLVLQGIVSLEEALKASNNPEDLKLKLSGIQIEKS